MGKSQPKAPDPTQTANAQAAANAQAVRESAKVNAVDQFGPWGSTTYQRNPDGTPASQTVSLTPQGDRILGGNMAIAEQLTNKAGQLVGQIPTGPMDLSGLPGRQNGIPGAGPVQMGVGSRSGEVGNFNPTGLPGLQNPALQTSVAPGALQMGVGSRSGEIAGLSNGQALPGLPGVGDFGAEAQRSQDAVFGKAQALLQPGQQLDRQRLEQSLSDRGIPLDSQAGQAELTRMERSQSEATNRAAFDAVAAGGAEQSRLFGLASSARGQAFGEDVTRYQTGADAADRRFGQDLAAAGFGNNAQAQQFGQGVQNAQLGNSAAGAMADRAAANRGQLFGEGLSQAGFNNASAGQRFDQDMASAGFGNAAQSQLFGQNAQGAGFQNQARNDALTEAMMLRSQSFNEASAMLQGAPTMGQPQFQSNPAYQVQAPNVAGLIQDDYRARVAQSNANRSGIMGGLFGLGTAAMGSPWMGAAMGFGAR